MKIIHTIHGPLIVKPKSSKLKIPSTINDSHFYYIEHDLHPERKPPNEVHRTILMQPGHGAVCWKCPARSIVNTTPEELPVSFCFLEEKLYKTFLTRRFIKRETAYNSRAFHEKCKLQGINYNVALPKDVENYEQAEICFIDKVLTRDYDSFLESILVPPRYLFIAKT